MLVFPERVLHGDLPNKDFLHLYGPGSLWVLAGWLKVCGVTLTARAHLRARPASSASSSASTGLARYWGRTAALPLRAALDGVHPPAARTHRARVGRWRRARAARAGSPCSTGADDSRPTSAPRSGSRSSADSCGARRSCSGSTSSSRSASVGWPRRGDSRGAFRKRLAARPRASGCSPYVIQLATAGPYRTFKGMVLDPVIYLRGGRRLPIPPPWDHLDAFLQRSGATVPPKWPIPSLTTPQQLFVWFFLLLLSVLTLVARRPAGRCAATRRGSRRACCSPSGCSRSGSCPQAVQRVDSAHFGWVSCVAGAFLPIAFIEIFRVRKPDVDRVAAEPDRGRRSSRSAWWCCSPTSPSWSYADYTLQTFGKHRVACKIERNGRDLLLRPRRRAGRGHADARRGPEDREAGREAVRRHRRICARRRTPTRGSTTCCPSTRRARTTSRWTRASRTRRTAGSRRTSRTPTSRSCSSVWNDFSEPNDSLKVGSDAANKVLAPRLLPRAQLRRPVPALPPVR